MKVPALPLVTVTSEASKPVTAWSKVKVKVVMPLLATVVALTLSLMVSSGATCALSGLLRLVGEATGATLVVKVRAKALLAGLVLPAASVALAVKL